MNLSLAAKGMLALAALTALIVFAVIVDLGVSAGRIHHGVSVADIDVGGMTLSEAYEVLARARDERREEPMVFSLEGVTLTITPAMVDWRPQPYDSAQRALAVGRSGGPVGALRARARAWTSGVRVGWAGGVNDRRVARLAQDWAETVEQMVGADVDDERLRVLIERAASTWPPRVYAIPLE